MHFSSILVTAVPASYSQCIHCLESLPGVEVHFRYPDRGRIVVTQETQTMRDQQEGFRRIQSLPEVLAAELVYHYHAAGLSSAREPNQLA
jgi:nitrate reductase NapAB chaperone NapD